MPPWFLKTVLRKITLRYVTLCYIYCSVLFNFVLFCSFASSNSACWTLCKERTEHASGSDGSQPDAQRAAGRAAGGGGHGASSGVMHESTEVREHITVETNAKPERRNSVAPFEIEPVVKGPDHLSKDQRHRDVANTTSLHMDSDAIEAEESKERRVSELKLEGPRDEM